MPVAAPSRGTRAEPDGHTSYAAGRTAPGIPARPGPAQHPARCPRHRAGAYDGTPQAPRPRFTNRMAILVVVVAVLVVSYASSMRAYLEQRSHINDLRAQIASSERDITALEREKRRWQDDEYVETQARERFGWVMPGETSYQVIDRDGKPLEQGDELTDPDSVARSVPDPWWDKVYGIARGGRPPRRRPRRRRRGSRRHRRPPPRPTRDLRGASDLRTSPSSPPSWAGRRGRSTRSRTGARAAIPTSWRPSRGSTTAPRSRRPST